MTIRCAAVFQGESADPAVVLRVRHPLQARRDTAVYTCALANYLNVSTNHGLCETLCACLAFF